LIASRLAANDDASLFLPVPWDELMDLGFCPALQLRGFPLAKTLPQKVGGKS